MSARHGSAPLVRDERMARAAWSRVAEPGDRVAAAVVAALGALEAWDWLLVASRSDGELLEPVAGLSAAASDRLARSVAGWSTRLPDVDPHRDLAHLRAIGGSLLIPGDLQWPLPVEDLGPAAPLCLWVVGDPDLARLTSTAVAVIGARAATAYGEHVTSLLAGGLADAGRTVLSGGAFGIDAAAHRAALAGDGASVAVLAGGLDRPYPVGNARLLAAVGAGGALVAEVPPGAAPTRSRFLLRNRLIAALSGATVVVEAAWRSGALSTAGHAVELLRPVGAVPGPVTAATSAGCHRLLRDGRAVCVTDVDEVLELVAPLDAGRSEGQESGAAVPDAEQLRVLEALPLRVGVLPEEVTRRAGLPLATVRAHLGTLELAGDARQDGGRWNRATQGTGGRTRALGSSDVLLRARGRG